VHGPLVEQRENRGPDVDATATRTSAPAAAEAESSKGVKAGDCVGKAAWATVLLPFLAATTAAFVTVIHVIAPCRLFGVNVGELAGLARFAQ
jgi:hypothetical protein